MKDKSTLYIDGDIIAYRCAFRAENVTNWGGDQMTVTFDAGALLNDLKACVADLQRRAECKHVVIALSCRTKRYWRHDVMPGYKSNRKGGRPPVALAKAKELLAEHFDSFERPGLEADDVLGILMTKSEGPKRRVLYSLDKDLRQVPGLHLDDEHDELIEVSAEEGDKWHMLQTLIGDLTDGYGGCPKVGPVKALKLIGFADGVEEMWPIVVAAYIKAGLKEEDALATARVARICLASDYDFAKKEVKLWHPPASGSGVRLSS